MRTLAVVVLIAGTLFGIASAEQDNVGAEVGAVVKDWIVPALKTAGINSVTITPIVWDNGSMAHAGPGIAQTMADALTKHDIGVVPGSRAIIGGKLSRVTDEKSKQPAIRLDVTLEIEGKVVASAHRIIYGEGEITQIEGINVTIDPKASPKDRAKTIEIARVNPPPITRTDANVWSGPEKIFGMEMSVRSKDGAKFEPREPDAKGFVKVRDGETYVVVLRSKAPFETAVKLFCDGLAWDTFAKFGDDHDEPGTRLVLVPASGETTVRGWPISREKSYAFDVARLPSIASARQGHIGVVTAEFYPAWKNGEALPPGEEKLNLQRSGLGTAATREQQDAFSIHPRQISNRLRGAVTIRYGE